MHILIVNDRTLGERCQTSQIVALCDRFGTTKVIELDALKPEFGTRPTIILVHIDLTHKASVLRFAELMQRSEMTVPSVFFIIDRSFKSAAQAYSLGASEVFRLPADQDMFTASLSDLARQDRDAAQTSCDRGVMAGQHALGNMFEATRRDIPLDMDILRQAGDSIDTALSRGGVDLWIDTVRLHHYGTYQHCLLVAGITVGFCQSLGFRRNDRQRMAKAALVHDIGKSIIPTSILDKPGRLDDEEMAIVRSHPGEGARVLRKHHCNERELIEIALHHHELLDGSGYPDRLSGAAVIDPVRIVTICDIYSSLIEKRSYKPPFSRDKAIGILWDMVPLKLDVDLVGEFVALIKGQALANGDSAGVRRIPTQ